ncbi:AraC family transcriptional regulator [Shinella sp. HZN7]|nr:AraC family transcriptional regulator [Shinella sp. HZN7]ANH06853.1 AraC family transcriptional regulator [Shinella sp. HZN7]
MLFVPLPFVVALLLLLRFVALLRQQEGGNRPFLALIGLCILQSIAVGLRWGYDVTAVRYVLPVLAGGLPPLVLASFQSLMHRDRADLPWLNAAPPVLIFALLMLAPDLIDGALVVIFVGYAVILLRLANAGPDGLDEARLDGAVGAHKALLIAAGSLCLSASLDIAIVLDFEWSRGENVPMIVSNANLLSLFLAGLTAAVAARARAMPVPPEEGDRDDSTSERDRDVLERVDRLLADQKLFRDENLTLARLARRAGVPARQISGAINRLTGRNVSQYINDFRIAEACRLLRDTDMPVTSAMLESGFQTKSNFNREFRRVTAMSPATWRAENRPPPS